MSEQTMKEQSVIDKYYFLSTKLIIVSFICVLWGHIPLEFIYMKLNIGAKQVLWGAGISILFFIQGLAYCFLRAKAIRNGELDKHYLKITMNWTISCIIFNLIPIAHCFPYSLGDSLVLFTIIVAHIE